jgi:hypothetical protein
LEQDVSADDPEVALEQGDGNPELDREHAREGYDCGELDWLQKKTSTKRRWRVVEAISGGYGARLIARQ